MIFEQGEKIHLIIRRKFEGDLRRHFVGEIKACSESLIRVEGYVFVFDHTAGEYIRRPERRARIISLVDSGNIVNVIPEAAKLEKVVYKMGKEGRLIITDGETFTLDVNEFGANL